MYEIRYTSAYGRAAVAAEAWGWWASVQDKWHAAREAERVFSYELTCRQSVIVNKRTGKVVGRYGRDERSGLIKRLGTR